MTTAQLLATLRTQLQDANKPGLAGVRALEETAQTVDALEDAVKLTEQHGATGKPCAWGTSCAMRRRRKRFTQRPRRHGQSTRRRGRGCG